MLYVMVDGRIEMGIALADSLRPEAVRFIQGVHSIGVHTSLLTGDRTTVATQVKDMLVSSSSSSSRSSSKRGS